MEFKQKKEVSGSEARSALKVANEKYTSCISKDFLNKFLAGQSVNVEDFCIDERKSMLELDTSVYGKLQF